MMQIVSSTIFILILGVALWTDLTKRKIPNIINVTGVICGILLAAIIPERTVLSAVIGFFVLLGVGLVIWNLHIIRAGDAKLLCVAGSFFGWQMGLNCLLFSILCGAVLGLPVVIYTRFVQKKKEKTKFPFALAISIGCLLSMKLGPVWELISIW